MSSESENQTGTGRMPELVNISNNQKHTIDAASFTLGRAPEHNVVLDDDGYASGDHARIYFENGGWWIEDLKSSNGTSVNEQLIAGPHKLAPGDTIKVGRTLFRIE